MMAGLDSPTAYDGIAEAYSRVFDPEGSGLRDPVLEELVGEVADERVLALACGQGQDARLLAALGASVVGIDISEQMLDYARGHEQASPRGIEYVQGDAQDLAAFAGESFDGVVCHMALMDIPKLTPTIRSAARVLRPEGWFVFSIVHPCYRAHVDNVTDYLADARYEKTLPTEVLPQHAYHRPVSAYVNELATAGFRISRLVEHHHEATREGGVPGLLYLRSVKASSRPCI